MALSIVIPSYRNPEYLDLCLKSATQNQSNPDNEFIVVLDGFGSESQAVLERYATFNLNVVEFEQNKGQQIAHNTGVTLANNEHVLIVNDDNVFPRNWDSRLNAYLKFYPDAVWTPNQIEPAPSMFRSFIIKNFGTTPSTFDFDAFCEFAGSEVGSSLPIGDDGDTWPLLIRKRHYMMLGGIDVSFPSPAVADWDFFFRCELAGLHCRRASGVPFYHFAGSATKATQEKANVHAMKERESFEYFAWKWGEYPTLNHLNKKRPIKGRFRGNI